MQLSERVGMLEVYVGWWLTVSNSRKTISEVYVGLLLALSNSPQFLARSLCWLAAHT